MRSVFTKWNNSFANCDVVVSWSCREQVSLYFRKTFLKMQDSQTQAEWGNNINCCDIVSIILVGYTSCMEVTITCAFLLAFCWRLWISFLRSSSCWRMACRSLFVWASSSLRRWFSAISYRATAIETDSTGYTQRTINTTQKQQKLLHHQVLIPLFTNNKSITNTKQ